MFHVYTKSAINWFVFHCLFALVILLSLGQEDIVDMLIGQIESATCLLDISVKLNIDNDS